MLDQFPSFTTMFGLDIFIVAVTTAATFFVLRENAELKASRAQIGAWLALAGLWVLTAVYVADLASMIVLPQAIGMPAAMDFMARLHTVYDWYATTIATAMIAAGLIVMLIRIMQETALRRESRRQLELHRDQFEQAAELANLGYYIYDPAIEVVEYCTETHARNHGLSKENYITQASTLSNDMPLIHPDDREELRKGYKRVQHGETVRLAYRAVTDSGTRQIREIVRPIYDASGEIVRELGTTLDVTDHMETEKLFFHSQKSESIGQLTGGIAHDFNNLLAVILGNLELLNEELTRHQIEKEIWEGWLKTSLSATSRGGELVKSLLSFARRAELDPETLDVNELISETDHWIRRTLISSIETEVSLDGDLWKTRLDRSAAQSALVNLMINAQHAMPKGGKLVIETSNVRLSDDDILERDEKILPGRYVMVSVTDTGIGIEKKNVRKIFDPFFTTRDAGEGSGLGLSMVQGFVRQSGGAIQVSSNVGIGTTIKLFFPASDNEGGDSPAKRRIGQPGNTTGARILLAEDEADLRDLLVRILTQEGNFVVAAASGDEALSLFEQDRDFDILITDIVMPGELQGPALASKIRMTNSSLPVIFLSGYAREAGVHGNGLQPEDTRIMKPVPRETLMEAIDDALRVHPRLPQFQLDQ